MNNKCFDRLTSLFEKLGIALDSKSSDKGELLAYCAGIDMVRNEFENNFKQIFVNTATGLGLSLLCELLKIDSTLSDDDKRNRIKQGLSEKYGDYIYGDFEREIDDLNANLLAAIIDFNMTMNGTIKGDYTLLPKLGRIFENYVPPFTVLGFCGNGLDFDYWDSAPYLFQDYDNFDLNFQFLDELT